MKPSFNLWTEAWITVEQRDGALMDLSLEQTLLRAPELLSLYDPSPLVIVGIHRLLAAVLQDIFSPQEDEDLARLWEQGCFPETDIKAFGERYAHRFDLYSEQEPFLQSADISSIPPEKKSELKSVTYLMPHLPSGSTVSHYHHSIPENDYFCSRCVARGLMTIPAFATSGGRGFFPSINGAPPPIYVIPTGFSLFETLAASLILPENYPSTASNKMDLVWWRHPPQVLREQIVHEVSYLHSLTFPARRIRLYPENLEKICTRCGEKSNWGVQNIVYFGGEHLHKEAPVWQDPFVAYSYKGEVLKTVLLQREKALWREYATLFLPSATNEKERSLPPTILYQRAELAEEGIGPKYELLPVRCIGMCAKKDAKIFEWLDASFDVPMILLRDEIGADLVQQALTLATDCADILSRKFFLSFSREGAEHHTDVKNRMLDAYWAALAAPFRTFILGVANPETRKAAYTAWVEATVAQGKQIFKEYADAIGDSAIALRHRVEGVNNCNRSLNARRKKELGEEERDS